MADWLPVAVILLAVMTLLALRWRGQLVGLRAAAEAESKSLQREMANTKRALVDASKTCNNLLADRTDLASKLAAATSDSGKGDGLPDFESVSCPECKTSGKFLPASETFDVPTDPRHELKRTGWGLTCLVCETIFCTNEKGEAYRKRVKPEPAPERKPQAGNATVSALDGMRQPRGRNG